MMFKTMAVGLVAASIASPRDVCVPIDPSPLTASGKTLLLV